MITIATAFLVALLISAILTPIIRDVALRKMLVDDASSSRKVHTRPIPRLGGVAIVTAFLIPLAGLFVVETDVGQAFSDHPKQALALFGGGLLIAGLGLWDDLRGASARLKLAVQLIAAVWVWSLGVRIELIANPFGDPISLGIMGFPITILWIVGVINAVNLIDGLDGLASGVAIAGLATNFVLALAGQQHLNLLFTACLAGAVLGFLIYNFHPASIFMGDTGSMFLGFALATTSLITTTKSSTTVAMLVPIIALGLPIADTLLAFTRRAVSGRSVFSPDKEHVHHRLLSAGLSQRQAVLVLYSFCVFLALAGLVLTATRGSKTLLVLVATSLVVAIFFNKLGYGLRLVQGVRDRPKNRMLSSLTTVVSHGLSHAKNLDDVDAQLRYFFLMISTRAFAVSTNESVIIQVGEKLPGQLTVFAPLGSQHHLRLHIHQGAAPIDRDNEIALERIAPALAEALERTAPAVTQSSFIRLSA